MEAFPQTKLSRIVQSFTIRGIPAGNFFHFAWVHLVGEATHQHTVPGQLTHVAGAQLPHLGRDAVLLHKRLLHRRHAKIRGKHIGEHWVNRDQVTATRLGYNVFVCV